MMSGQDAWTTVFGIPELLVAIISLLDLKSLCAVRLVNRHFFSQCEPYYSLFIDVKDEKRRPFLGHLLDMAHHGTGSASSWGRIRSLRIRQDVRWVRDIPDFQYLASLLNFCHNLEEIRLEDTPGNMGLVTEKSRHPARKFWANLTDTEPLHTNSPDYDMGHENLEVTSWSYWDILPLEGQLLSRLETLKVVSGLQTPLNFDHFLTRLGSSCVAKTLRSFALISSWGRQTTVNWTTLRDCVCSLTALENLELKSLTLISNSSSHKYDNNNDDDDDDAVGGHGGIELAWVAPRVKSLNICCLPDLKTKLAIMSLFRNVESLTLEDPNELWEPAMDQQLFTHTGNLHRAVHTASDLPIFDPFPRLNFLDVMLVDPNSVTKSTLVHYWIQRRTGLRVATLLLLALSPNSLVKGDTDLILLLVEHSVQAQTLYLIGEDKDFIRTVLMSSVFHTLDDLELTETKQDLVEIVQSILRPNLHVSQWQLAVTPAIQKQMTDMLPWSHTLTTLALALPMDSRRDTLQGVATLGSVRSFLLMLPRLEDLELLAPLEDLTLFDGLGRKETLAGGKEDHDQQSDDSPALKPLEISRRPLENYCITERPLLKRLMLRQSYRYNDPKSNDPLETWRSRLLHKFRFLSNLHLERHSSNTT